MTGNNVHFGCPSCVSFSHADTEEQAQSKAQSHNESRHGGEQVARVIEPDSEDDVDDFVKEGREHATPEQYEELIREITRGNTPYTVATINE